MIYGIGNDIIEIDRIAASIARHKQHFLDRVFTKQEQEYCENHRESAQHYAGRFAAKEAVVKALGTGIRDGISWCSIEILNNGDGKPIVLLSLELEQRFHSPQILVSISHCRAYASAVAIWVKNN